MDNEKLLRELYTAVAELFDTHGAAIEWAVGTEPEMVRLNQVLDTTQDHLEREARKP